MGYSGTDPRMYARILRVYHTILKAGKKGVCFHLYGTARPENRGFRGELMIHSKQIRSIITLLRHMKVIERCGPDGSHQHRWRIQK